MAGVTKHIYDHEIRDIQAEWSKQLKAISKVLPRNYEKTDILKLLKKYYPHEWKAVEYKKQYYDIKDRHIKRHKGKSRYNMQKPDKLLEFNPMYKRLLKRENREKYAKSFSQEKCEEEEAVLWKTREKKIRKIDEKISKAVSKTQTVTPDFLDSLIGLYEKKSTSQKDRVYIIYELEKYYNPKVISFFFKCNDTEMNEQLRNIAFKHLQSFNYQPRLRKQQFMQVHVRDKNRKKYLMDVYPYETFDIDHTPKELEYRLHVGREQKVKSYKYFISHSSADAETVQKLIDYENRKNILVFCDWINDSDYLKRKLACEATLRVIEWRLRQSEELIFVRSEKSMMSVWCQYELNFFHELDKPIVVIDKESIDNGIFKFNNYDEKEYLNNRYREMVLI